MFDYMTSKCYDTWLEINPMENINQTKKASNKHQLNNQLSETDTRNNQGVKRERNPKVRFVLSRNGYTVNLYSKQIVTRHTNYNTGIVESKPRTTMLFKIVSKCGKFQLRNDACSSMFEMNKLDNVLKSRGEWVDIVLPQRKTQEGMWKDTESTLDLVSCHDFDKVNTTIIKSEFAEYFI